MVDLPFDVWVHIAQFIPDNILQDLLSVNRPLFDMAMDLRYKKVSFGYNSRENYRVFARLQDPFVAPRIRTLNLTPQGFVNQPKYKRRVVDRVKDMVLRRKSGPATVLSGPAKEAAIYGFSRMSFLTCLHLSFSEGNYGELGVQLILAAWTAFCPNLRELSINTLLETTSQILPSSLVFPKLEVLSMTFQTTPCNIELSSLTMFINRHQPTLRSFSLTIGMACDERPNVDLLFVGLGYFPHLRSIAINIPFPNVKAFAQNVLHCHAPELRELKISRYSSGSSWETITLPNLSLLSLSLVDNDIPEIISYLRPLANSLTSLTLSYCRFSFPAVRDLLEVFTCQDKLRVLRLELARFLSPQFFDLCSEKLPSVHELTLTIPGYGDLDHDSGIVESNEEMFCQQMLTRSYTNWRLCYLHIFVKLERGSNAEPCNVVLVKVLPLTDVTTTVIHHLRWLHCKWW